MTYAYERCRVCGCVPNWHLVWKRALSAEVEAARTAGLPEPEGELTAWRNIYRHEKGRPCSYLNEAHSFAPMSLAPPDARFTVEGQRRIRQGLPAEEIVIEYERGDAWEEDRA
jgi:hypothetical protein